MRLNGSEQFRAKTRSLRKKLGFINHVKNKAVGHLDKALLERAAHWSPQLFYQNAKGNEKYRVFESYRAVLESSINSFLSDEGRQQARQDFSRKLKWGPSDFSDEKFSWRLLPSAARVRPVPAAAHNFPSVRCAPLACANDLTPCRDGLAF